MSAGPEERLRALARSGAGAGIFSDFDGCLSPIVPVPADARPADGVEDVLAALAERFRVVAIVSGREVSFLRARVRAPGVRLIGLHGAEQLLGDEVVVSEAARAARAAIDRAAERLTLACAAIHGVAIEHKGYALAVHFRRAEDPDEVGTVLEPLVRTVAASEGLSVEPARRVFELRAPGGGSKGDAVANLIAETGVTAALVAGDDTGDVAAFEAAAGLDPLVRVAVASSESPPELLDAADLSVDGPAAYVALLRKLAAATAP